MSPQTKETPSNLGPEKSPPWLEPPAINEL